MYHIQKDTAVSSHNINHSHDAVLESVTASQLVLVWLNANVDCR